MLQRDSAAASRAGRLLSTRHLVTRVVEELQPLGDVLAGAEQVEQLLVVDLQQGDFHGELGAVLRELLENLMQRSGDDTGQRVLEGQTQRQLVFFSLKFSDEAAETLLLPPPR